MSRKNVLCSRNVRHYFSNRVLISLLMFMNYSICNCLHSDIWEKIPCDEYFQPDHCDFDKIQVLTVDDFYRCGPANLPLDARNYFLGAAGERITYNENKKAYKRLRIIPTYLRDTSKSSLAIQTLGQHVAFPIGLSPVAIQKLADPEGEIATVKAISDMGNVMIVSSYASTPLEEVALHKGSSHLWMQTIIHRNRSLMADIVTRAERSRYEAIVLTVDLPKPATVACDARKSGIGKLEMANFPGHIYNDDLYDPSATFKIISWLKSITRLPIVTKGILTALDARLAISAGASAILVSDHGGRQLDSVPATIEALPEVVDAVNKIAPHVDVYVDGGVRTGQDVYKAIAMGAKMAFFGRPIVFGLAKDGERGVKEVVNILKREFNETMIISGAANPSGISRYNVKPAASQCDRGGFAY